MSRNSCSACGLTVSQIRALRAFFWQVRAVNKGRSGAAMVPVPSSSTVVRSSARQQCAQSPVRTGSSSRPHRVQRKLLGIPVQSVQAGVPSRRPGNSRCWAQPGQVPWMRVARS
ncbi:hypothetical protein ABL57_18290 [Kocuria sp. SM24M-10]|nr:hypothetical protein ABL57_18290 [Kocuria sp. SM24M-10]